MDLAQWLSNFKALHEKARSGALDDVEGRTYAGWREELARALVTAQGLNRKPEQTPRQALRITRVLQVSLEGRGRQERLATSELSLGGFSARMVRAPAPDEELTATLRLPGAEPVVTPVEVAGSKAEDGFAQVSFRFRKLEGAPAERLELAIFDFVLAKMHV